jgi:hypothetical protein
MLAALLAGCADEPAAPPADAMAPPSFAAVHDAFTLNIPWDGQHQEMPCLGAWITTYGSFDVHFRTTTTPSGNEIWQWWLGYDYPLGMIVDGTGEDWSFVRGVDTGGSLTKPTGEYREQWRLTEWYENAAGQELRSHWVFHLMIDGDGNVTLEKFLNKCKVYD